MEDYVTAGSKAERQRRLADLLRKMAVQTSAQYTTDPGRMVSGHYVAPSWAQGLNANVVQPMQANQAAAQSGQMADQMEGAYNQRVNEAQQAWQSSLPQSVPGTPEMAGPVDPNNPQELAATPGQPLTPERVLKHTMAGMQIPGNEKMAGLYNQSALADMAREDTQAFRSQEAAATRAARLQENIDKAQARADDLKMKLEDRALDRASREQMSRESNALRAQIAQGSQELQRLAIEARNQAVADKRETAATKKAELTAKERETLDSADATATALSEGIKTLENSKDSNWLGYGAGLASNFVPGGTSLVQRQRPPEINKAIQMITYTTDEIRHGRFGSALTATEKASAMQYLPGEYDDKKTILWKAKGVQDLVKLNNSRMKSKGSAPGGATATWEQGTPGVVDFGSLK